MEKLLVFCLFGVVLSACHSQSSAPPTTAATVLATTRVVAAPTGVPVAAARDAGPSLALLQRVDLAAVWANHWGKQEQQHPMEGFYGADHYHISFFFDEVRRDPQQPAAFRVRGRTRYKKVITPFSGTITVTRLAPLVDTVSLENSQRAQAYTAFGNFVLTEDPATRGAGVYRGQALLDFCVNAQGDAVTANFSDMDAGSGNPTKGSGLLFEGVWRSNRTGTEKPVAWSSVYEVIVPDALQQMGLGQRGAEPNPRLAKYGWFETMENDEWWNNAPKPPVSL